MRRSSTLLLAFACGALFLKNAFGKYLLVDVEGNGGEESPGNLR